MKAKQNAVSKEIPKLKKKGKDCAPVFAEMKELSAEIKEKDDELKATDEALRNALLYIPNLPNKDICLGESDADNREVRRWGEPRQFDFDIKAHWDLGTDLDILDFERAAKVTGARFSAFKGRGSQTRTRADQLYAADAYERTRLYGNLAAVYRKPRQHDGNRPASEI